MQRSRVADKSRTRIQVEDRKPQLILRLIGPVSVERVRNGMGPGNHHSLGSIHCPDLRHQRRHGTAVDDFSRDAAAQTSQRGHRRSQRLGSFRTLSLRVRVLRGELPERLGDIKQRQILQKIHQKMSFGVGRNQDNKGRITAVEQFGDVNAVVGAQGLFSQDDDGITHGYSVVPGNRSPQTFGRRRHVDSDSRSGAPRGPHLHQAMPGSSNNGTMASTTPPASDAADKKLSLRTKWAIAGFLAGGTVAGLVGAGSSALAVYFARRVITPAARHEDQEVLAVIRGDKGPQVILAATPDTTIDGVFSLFFSGGQGHARIGRIVSYSPAEQTVLREVEEVYSGNLSEARRAWWSGATYPDPAAIGLAAEDVDIEIDGGKAPAWLIRAEASAAAPVCAIMVHGRGATRLEGLRAVRTARELGMDSLLISYRNDGLAPSAPDGRYGLGSTEWRDVEAAMEYALEHGAQEIVLFGWSMGGAISLQTADLSKHRHLIRALVLDAPVINWVNVMAHHAEMNRIPYNVGRYGQMMLSHPLGRRLTGLSAPVDLKAMDWETRAVELRTPTLLIHSVDDDYVPFGPSASLAEKNPEMVTFEPFDGARHTKEWNVDPERWERVVRAWLQRQLAPRNNPGGTGAAQGG